MYYFLYLISIYHKIYQKNYLNTRIIKEYNKFRNSNTKNKLRKYKKKKDVQENVNKQT